MFNHVLNNVKCNNTFSLPYITERGTLQGDTISPLIFCIFLYDLCIKLQYLKIGYHVDYHRGILYINSRFYVDDTLIFDHLIQCVTQLTNTVVTYSISNLYTLHQTKTVLLPWYHKHGWVLNRSGFHNEITSARNQLLHQKFDQDTWSIDSILAYNSHIDEFLVKWSGFGNSHNSWISCDLIDIQTAQKFIKNHNSSQPLLYTFLHHFCF